MAQTTIMPERVTEQAMLAYLTAKAIDGLQLLARFDMTAEVLPCLKITCSSCQPDYIDDIQVQTGNWIVELALTLKSHAQDTTGAAHDALMGAVIYAVYTDAIVTDLNAATTGDEFTAFDIRMGARRNWNDEDHFYTEQIVNVYMQPS